METVTWIVPVWTGEEASMMTGYVFSPSVIDNNSILHWAVENNIKLNYIFYKQNIEITYPAQYSVFSCISSFLFYSYEKSNFGKKVLLTTHLYI